MVYMIIAQSQEQSEYDKAVQTPHMHKYYVNYCAWVRPYHFAFLFCSNFPPILLPIVPILLLIKSRGTN